jgi:hypothetical protein
MLRNKKVIKHWKSSNIVKHPIFIIQIEWKRINFKQFKIKQREKDWLIMTFTH